MASVASGDEIIIIIKGRIEICWFTGSLDVFLRSGCSLGDDTNQREPKKKKKQTLKSRGVPIIGVGPLNEVGDVVSASFTLELIAMFRQRSV